MKLGEKLGFTGTTISICGIAFGWGLFPLLLKMQIGKFKGLVPGSEARSFWEKIPFAIHFKAHIFNVTNYMAVQTKGEIPELEEIGPYQYSEWKEKTEVIDYEGDDSVSFFMKNTWFFEKEKTAPLTGKETIIIPHPVLVGLITAVERDKAGVLPMVNKAIPILFNKPESIFIKTTVYDFLFGGILLNCSTKDFAAAAVCAVLKKESTDLEPVSGDIYKFSALNQKNGTNDPFKYQIYRGINDFSKVGEVFKVNGKKKISNWRGKPCNNLVGTDATVFPPDVKPENDIWSFNGELCRSLPAKYTKKSEYQSIPTLRYNVSLGDMSTEPSLKCLCPSENVCLKRGVMDLMKCTGSPIYASLPHFYDSDESYQTGVKGLKPNEEDHSIYLDIEPMTGTPVYAKKRIQFSFPIHKINKIDITQNLPTTVLPFLWVEEGIELPEEFVNKLDQELFQVLRIVNVIKWLITIFGAAIVSGGIGLYYKQKNALPVTPSSSGSDATRSTEFLADKLTQNPDLGKTKIAYIN